MKDRPRALAVLVAIFLIGIIVGTAGSYFWLKSSTSDTRPLNIVGSPIPPNGAVRPKPPAPPELNLTSEQEKQLMEIWSETREKMQELGKEHRGQMAELDKKRNEIWAEHDSKIRSVLDEDQEAKLNDWMQKVRDSREKSPRRMGPEAPKEKRRKTNHL